MPRFMYLSVLLLLIAGCATHALTSGRVVVQDNRTALDLRFTERDRVAINDYYHGHGKPKKSPPGLAKREQLPPGLARRETLPPGLQGRVPPRELEARLTVLPAPYVRVIVGRDFVLMDRNTRVVFDILHNVVLE